MTVIPLPHAGVLVRKLESIFRLSEDERAAIERLPLKVREVRAGEVFVREGDRPSQCCVVLSGMVARQKVVSNGRRQIFMFHIAGDVPDLQSLHIDVMDHEIAALMPGHVALVPHTVVRALTDKFPRITSALWRDTLIDAAVFRAWLVNIGQRSAYSRIAHLFCELTVRARAVGLDQDGIDHLPTQQEIGDALGMSLVHVNRTMRELRENGLVSTEGRRRLTILDWPGLQQAAEFDPSYLHLEKTG